jgi:hypothetical protein
LESASKGSFPSRSSSALSETRKTSQQRSNRENAHLPHGSPRRCTDLEMKTKARVRRIRKTVATILLSIFAEGFGR